MIERDVAREGVFSGWSSEFGHNQSSVSGVRTIVLAEFLVHANNTRLWEFYVLVFGEANRW